MPTRGNARERRVAEQTAAFSAEVANLTPAAMARKVKQLEAQMHEHAKNLEVEEAAMLRDKVAELKQLAFLS